MKIGRLAFLVNRYRVASLLIHVGALIGIGALLRHIATARHNTSPVTPVTAHHLVLSMPGSTETGSPKAPPKNVAQLKPASPLLAVPRPQRKGQLSQIPHTGEGVLGHSAWGKGEITIAYTKFFPHPAPDLSTMPPGTEGDVVLTALIDEQGKISGLTLLAGIGPVIDHEVIQTVRQWTFTPATKDGLPISSRQELHFHFRSSRDS
ncbi:MAG TPA: energy transducer TonB [Acidobacteriaceae bacterium]